MASSASSRRTAPPSIRSRSSAVARSAPASCITCVAWKARRRASRKTLPATPRRAPPPKPQPKLLPSNPRRSQCTNGHLRVAVFVCGSGFSRELLATGSGASPATAPSSPRALVGHRRRHLRRYLRRHRDRFRIRFEHPCLPPVAPAVVRQRHQHRAQRADREAPPDRIDAQRRLQQVGEGDRSEEHTSELQSLMRISYAVFCLKKNK